MSLKDFPLGIHPEGGYNTLAGNHFLHGAYQQHGIPVGDDLLDFFLRQFHMIEHSSVCSPSAC